jgi:hypothetical protein
VEQYLQIVKASIRLEFSEALQPWLELRALLRSAEGNDTRELQNQPFIVLREPERQRVTFTVRAASVECEADLPLREMLRSAVTTVDAMNAAVPFPALATLRVDTILLDGFELPFHELNARMKERFLRPSRLSTAATDLQVTVDESVGDGVTNHIQVGPMDPAQLNRMILAFARQKLPDPFLFMALSRTWAPGPEYGVETVNGLLSEYATWVEATSNELAQFVRT